MLTMKMNVHYASSGFNSVYEKDMFHPANKGAQLLVNTVRSICVVTNEKFPGFYNETKYRPIK